jgi:hypothetical protein
MLSEMLSNLVLGNVELKSRLVKCSAENDFKFHGQATVVN